MKLAVSGKITAKEMEQGLGRLGFAANALTWERPFLGPLYSWTAAIRGKRGVLRIPVMLRTLLYYLHKRLSMGHSLQEPPVQEVANDFDVEFFTDAKATEEDAWIGGFLQSKSGEILEWFSEKIERSWADWLFCEKGFEEDHCVIGTSCNSGGGKALDKDGWQIQWCLLDTGWNG